MTSTVRQILELEYCPKSLVYSTALILAIATIVEDGSTRHGIRRSSIVPG